MINPVLSDSIIPAALAGAAIVLFGALYAFLFAFARLNQMKTLMFWAYGAYGLLVVAVIVLARLLHLNGLWAVILLVMLAGYLAGPFAIWKLCINTHKTDKHINTDTVTGATHD